MSLQNTYERKLAKNLLCVGAATSTYAIDGATQLYIGLITDGGFGVTTVHNAMGGWVQFNEQTNQVTFATGGLGNFSTPTWNNIIALEPAQTGTTNTFIAADWTGVLPAPYTAITRANLVANANGYFRIPLNVCSISEASSTYAAVSVAPNSHTAFLASWIDANIIAPTGTDTIVNQNAIKFNTAQGSNWGNIVGWFITDSPALGTLGNVFLVGYTNNNVTININDRPIFNPSSLSFQVQ